MVYKVTEETIKGIANAIRAKTNSTEEIEVQDFAAEILNIETGENTTSAAQSARDAEASAISAASSAQAAEESAAFVASGIKDSKIWATGEGAVEGDEAYENNAKYYSEVAKQHSEDADSYRAEVAANAGAAQTSADNAAASATAAQESENATKENLDHAIDIVQNLEGFNSEAWAVGTRNGVAVTEDDATYQNNSKYWSDTARATVADFQANVGVSNVLATATVVEEVTT